MDGWAIQLWIRSLSVSSFAKSSGLAVFVLEVVVVVVVVVGLCVLTDRKLGTC